MIHKKFLMIQGVLLVTIAASGFMIHNKPEQLPPNKAEKIIDVKQIIQEAQASKVEVVEDVVEEISMPEYDIKLSKELQKYTYNLCNEYGLAYEMVLSLFYTESKFDIKAINKNTNGSADKGIAQINERYSKEFSARAGIHKYNPYNPQHNIKTAIVHINYLREYWISQGIDDEERLWWYLIGSYNRGINGFKSYVRNNKTIKTEYGKKILYYKEILETEGRLE